MMNKNNNEIEEWILNLVKISYFYVDPRESKGNGDLIYNTLRKIIETDDKSPWAQEAYKECRKCLVKGLRWPDYMAQFITTDNHTQTKMTRDPWIMLYCCAVHLREEEDIKNYKPQFYLYTPEVWAWRKHLINKPNAYKFWRWLNGKLFEKDDYVKVLDAYMRRYAFTMEFRNKNK